MPENENDNGSADDAAAERIAKAVESLIGKNGGNAQDAAFKLVQETHDLRAQKREIRKELDALKAQMKDAVILKGDDAKRWQAFEKLGLKPDEIAPAIERGKAAETENSELKARDADRAVAESMGWKAGVWTDQRKLRNLAVEMRDVTVEENGQQVTKKVPHVRTAGDEKAPWEPLEKYAEAQLGDYLPALTAEKGNGGGGGGSTTNGQGPAAKATGWPKQVKTEKPATSGDKAAAFIERRAAASALDKSPLAKAAGLK